MIKNQTSDSLSLQLHIKLSDLGVSAPVCLQNMHSVVRTPRIFSKIENKKSVFLCASDQSRGGGSLGVRAAELNGL